MKYVGAILLLISSICAREIIFSIADLDGLEDSLRNKGVSEVLVQTIYSAASCNLKVNKNIEQKLDKLIAPMESLHSRIEEVMTSMKNGKMAVNPREGIAEMMIKHVISIESENTEVLDDEVVHLPRVMPSHNAIASYHPLEVQESTIGPDLCKTLEVTLDLIKLARARKTAILDLATTHYGYTGETSISKLALFYYKFVVDNYSDKFKVMGLAKLLGDYSSLSAEVYYMEEAYNKNINFCESNTRQVRHKRNVPVSIILPGSCSRFPGVNNNTQIITKAFKEIPFIRSYKRNLLALGRCNNFNKTAAFAEELNSREMLSINFEIGTDACISALLCNQNQEIKNGVCATGAGTGSYTNVEGFTVSVVQNRMKLDEVPSELLTLEKVYCTIDFVRVLSSELCRNPLIYMQKFLAYQIGGKWKFTDKKVTIGHGQDVSSICFYSCSNCVDCTQCKGDMSYELVFGRFPSASCSCNYNQTLSDLYIQIGTAKLAVDAIGSVEWEVAVPVSNVPVSECASCKASCSGTTVSIERDVSYDVLHLCLEMHCTIIPGVGSDVKYEIPSNLFHITEFDVKFYRSDGRGSKSIGVTCTETHNCESINCDICILRFANPHCYKPVNWILMVLTVTLLILVIPAIYAVFMILKVVVCLILIPLKYIFKVCKVFIVRSSRKSRRNIKRMKKTLDEYAEEGTVELDEVKLPRPSKFSMILIVYLLTAVLSATACDNMIGISTKQMSCVTSATGKVSCKVNTIIDLPLSGLGEESCISVKDQNEIIIQVIKIKTTAIRQKCLKNVLYFTVEPDFTFFNLFRCRAAGTCVDDVCEKVPTTGPVPIAYIDKTKAGISGCARVTGFWGKGCFYSGQACNFYKAELRNHEKISYEVSRCSEWVWEIVIKIDVKTSSKEEAENVTLMTSVPSTTNIGVVQLQTVNSPINTAVNKCFVKRLTKPIKSAITDCSDRGLMTPGRIGEIQCATSNLADSASSACLIGQTSHQVVPQDDNVVFISKFVNVTQVWLENMLPKNISSDVVDETELGQTFIHYSGSTNYNLRIRMDGYDVTFDYNKAKCEAHFRSLSGCSNCGSGASLILEIIPSGAERIPVSLTCPSSTSESLELISSAKPTHVFKMSFTKQEINEECVVKCPGSQLTLVVTGTLLNTIKLSNYSSKSTLGTASDFFRSVPWLDFGFMRYFYIILGIMVLVPIGLLIFRILILLINSIGNLLPSAKSREYRKYN
nr:MAG: glycoprotein [Anopheles phasivirus 2]